MTGVDRGIMLLFCRQNYTSSWPRLDKAYSRWNLIHYPSKYHMSSLPLCRLSQCVQPCHFTATAMSYLSSSSTALISRCIHAMIHLRSCFPPAWPGGASLAQSHVVHSSHNVNLLELFPAVQPDVPQNDKSCKHDMSPSCICVKTSKRPPWPEGKARQVYS